MSTIFTKIINREIPATIVYEDDSVLAFLDINPINPGHTVVIPKVASVDVCAATPEEVARVMLVAQKVAVACVSGLNCDGVNFLMNAGEAAGQEIFHTHMHVIPRHLDDGLSFSTKTGEYKDDAAAKIADKIKAEL